MYGKEYPQQIGYSNQLSATDAVPRGPVEVELDLTNDLIDNVGHALERLEQSLRLVLASQPPQAVSETGDKKQSECDLQGRMISTNAKLSGMAARLESIIHRIRV